MTDSQNTTTTSAQSLSVEDYPFPIAFIGKAGSGKSTASARLQLMEPSYRVVSFARVLKDVSKIMWENPGRSELQWLGNAAREFDSDIWIRNAKLDIEACYRSGHVPVIDDCRFPNEVQTLRDRDFRIVRLHCREEVRVDRLQRNGRFQSYEQLEHITETALDDYEPDWTIDTTPFDAQMEDIDEALARVMTQLRRRT